MSVYKAISKVFKLVKRHGDGLIHDSQIDCDGRSTERVKNDAGGEAAPRLSTILIENAKI